MPFKFESLEVWQLALAYNDLIQNIASQLPQNEAYNLKSQIIRAVTSVALNIAEGSTGQTNAEQARFLSLAIRSLVETVACIHLIRRSNLLSETTGLDQAYQKAEILVAKLHTFRKYLAPHRYQTRELEGEYSSNAGTESPDL